MTTTPTQNRAVIYIRVSTEKQTLEPQQIELWAYAKAKGWTIIEEYQDVISGAKTAREGFDAMMQRVRAGGVDIVMVVKLDRLARSVVHFCQIVAEFEKLNVALVATSQGIDTSHSNPGARMQMQILAAFAEFERSLISERTKAGLEAARARGKTLGRPSPVLVENWREVVSAHNAQHGPTKHAELAKELGGVSSATAWRLLHDLRAVV